MKYLGKLQLPSGLKGQANALLSASRFPQPGMELARGTCAEPCGAGSSAAAVQHPHGGSRRLQCWQHRAVGD